MPTITLVAKDQLRLCYIGRSYGWIGEKIECPAVSLRGILIVVVRIVSGVLVREVPRVIHVVKALGAASEG